TLLFAKNNLSEEEFRLFQRLFSVLNATFPKPDLLLYLHRPVDVLLRQIRQRARDMERLITGEYLEELQNAYLDHFKRESETPVVVLELDDADFLRDNAVFQAIIKLLNRDFQAGVQYVPWRELSNELSGLEG
ncbi:MAG: deoxynucleoside kinase, partial [Thermoanaerobaculia bacterium]|nr:deoxynucleoside kinase [Thermoanaerobaculia bacterium]